MDFLGIENRDSREFSSESENCADSSIAPTMVFLRIVPKSTASGGDGVCIATFQ